MNLEYLIHLARRGSSDVHPGGERATRALLSALDLHPHDRVLEIGCGTGSTLLRLIQRDNYSVIGVEYLPQMLDVARRRLKIAARSGHAHLLQSDAVRLPFPDQAFDRVYTESVLGFQEVEHVVEMLGEIQRVLRPGGLYVANEAIWKPQPDQGVVAEINRSCEDDFGLRQSTDQAWSITQWLDAIQAAGFRVRSANLLEAHLETVEEEAEQPGAFPTLTARLFSWSYRLRSTLDLRMILQDIRYQRLLKKHAADGRYLEERLFILEKI